MSPACVFASHYIMSNTCMYRSLKNLTSCVNAHRSISCISVSDQKIVDIDTYLVVKNNYDNKADALDACRNGFAPTGEFDLAILDTTDKIATLRSFLSTVVPGTSTPITIHSSKKETPTYSFANFEMTRGSTGKAN